MAVPVTFASQVSLPWDGAAQKWGTGIVQEPPKIWSESCVSRSGHNSIERRANKHCLLYPLHHPQGRCPCQARRSSITPQQRLSLSSVTQKCEADT